MDATTGKIKDVAQGSVFNFKPVVVDVDNKMEDLHFTTKNLPEWLELKIDTTTHEPSLVNKANRPDNSDVIEGTYPGIQICVDDDADSAPAICLTLPTITVTDVNDAPVFGDAKPKADVDQSNGNVIRGGAYNFNPPITDADTAKGGLTIKTKLNGVEDMRPDWLEFIDIDGDGIPNLVNKVNRPDNDDAGGLDENQPYDKIDICVSDGKAEVCMGAFTITVNNVNELPIINGDPVTSINQAYGTFPEGVGADGNPKPVAKGEAYNFTPDVSDKDDTLTKESYLVIGLPAWAEFSYDEAEKKPSLVNKADRPNNGDVGTYEKIKFCVTDGVNPLECPIKFSITVENVNDPPTIGENPDATKSIDQVTANTADDKKAAGAVYTFTPTYNDPDKDIRYKNRSG